MIEMALHYLLTLGSVLLAYCSGECYYEHVLGAHLRPKNQIFDKLDVQSRMLDVLDQWCDVREEDLRCSIVHSVDICQYHSIEQALLLDAPVRLEDLSIIKHLPSALYDSALVVTSSLLFPGGTHCYIDSKTGAKVLAKQSCDEFITAVANDLGFGVNITVDLKMYQYIIASGTSITASVRSHDQAKVLGLTSIYTKTIHLRTEQLMKEMQQIMSLIMTIETTAGMDVFTTSLLLSLASCLHTDESALLGSSCCLPVPRQPHMSCGSSVSHTGSWNNL